jgi:ABC-type glycerol-3-phosphate transport system permease component
MSMPIVGTLAIINVIGIWNDVIWPSLIIEDTSLLTVAAGLFTRFGGLTTNYPLQFSGFVITSVPLMFLFIFATRFYVEGMSSSGLKM